MKNETAILSEHDNAAARAAIGSIVDLVAALSVDYDRLAELRDARDSQLSVINGTMHPADLIPAFIDELEVQEEAASGRLAVEASEFLACIPATAVGNDRHSFWDSEEAAELLAELFGALNNHAEDGLYFGAHPGDGSDYGFWLTEDDASELAALEDAAGDCESEEDARRRIEEDALSVEVRSAWQSPGTEFEPVEYRIVVCTGGPHVEIRGDLNAYNEPETAAVYFQDWFTPLTEWPLSEEEEAAILEYARVFYFGE